MKQMILSLFTLLILVAANAQTEKDKTVIRGGYGIAYNYIFSSQKTNSSPSSTLFQGDGHNISFKLRVGRDGKLLGIVGKPSSNRIASTVNLVFDAGFQFGRTSTKDLEAFAKSLTTPLGYKIMQSSKNWQQFLVLGGPMLRLAKRYNGGLQPIEISATAGAAFKLSPRTITIDKMDAAVPGARVFNETENNTAFAWQANVSVPVLRLGKRINGCIDAGYGFNGATAGVSFRLGKRITGL